MKNQQSSISSLFQDVLHLFFPHTCVGCNEVLYKNESFLCTVCEFELPETNFDSNKENKAAQLLAGRTSFETCYALYYYQRAGKVQQILKSMKYGNGAGLCVFMGQRMGRRLNTHVALDGLDLVLPLPLHPKKQRQRGYNQSEELSKGIADIMAIPMNNTALIRTDNNTSQTSKTRTERWQNVANIFEIKDEKALIGKHVLLVDDVLTTGATLEACCNELNKVDGIKVSIATFALA